MDNTGRISRLYDLMDEQLSEINDNPVYEQYRKKCIRDRYIILSRCCPYGWMDVGAR